MEDIEVPKMKLSTAEIYTLEYRDCMYSEIRPSFIGIWEILRFYVVANSIHVFLGLLAKMISGAEGIWPRVKMMTSVLHQL